MNILSQGKTTVSTYQIEHEGNVYEYREYYEGRKMIDAEVSADFDIENEEELLESFSKLVGEPNFE